MIGIIWENYVHIILPSERNIGEKCDESHMPWGFPGFAAGVGTFGGSEDGLHSMRLQSTCACRSIYILFVYNIYIYAYIIIYILLYIYIYPYSTGVSIYILYIYPVYIYTCLYSICIHYIQYVFNDDLTQNSHRCGRPSFPPMRASGGGCPLI